MTPSRYPFVFIFLFSFSIFISHLCSDPPLENKRIPWSLDETYNGSFMESFNKLRWEVPNIIRQTTIDITVRLGMDFQEGWAYPLIVRFVEESPHAVENILAYVQYQVDESGNIQQTLNINLKTYERESFNFNRVFAHELVHAMINDAVGPENIGNFPLWLHEGLAVYGSNQGEQMLKSYVLQYEWNRDDYILTGLEGPHTPLDYAEDYLAIKYIYDEHGINSLHNFVREFVHRKGDINGSLEYTCFENWETFQKNVRKYSLEQIAAIKHDKRSRGNFGKPF